MATTTNTLSYNREVKKAFSNSRQQQCFLQPFLTPSYKGGETLAEVAQRGCGLPSLMCSRSDWMGFGVPWSSVEGIPAQGRGWNEMSFKDPSNSYCSVTLLIFFTFPAVEKWLPAGKIMCWQQQNQVIFGRVLLWVSVLAKPLDFQVCMKKRRMFQDCD